METDIRNESGNLVAKKSASLVIRGVGGFGHKGTI